ncbi:cytochrome b [Halomonas denitrificans]|nr:cytochrome b [Halomonas denitrificans]
MDGILRNTETRYGLVAQLFHWTVAIGIVLQFIWAWRIDQADSIRLEYQLVIQHKSIGMTVLILALLRIAWRLFNAPPALPSAMARRERRAAAFTHWALYGLILFLPLSGWVYSSAAGYGAELFGWVEIPDLVGQSEAVEAAGFQVHRALGWVLLGLVGIHVAAAMHHHFVRKDTVLKRMLPKWN